MEALTSWDIVLLIAAVYLAVLALVRLMARYRDQLVDDLRRQIEEEKRRTSARKKPSKSPESPAKRAA